MAKEKQSRVKDGNYYVVQAFMVKDLKLKGLEKDLYAIIYGFSQAENQAFTGSLQYLADWTCASKQAVMNALKKLVDKQLLLKKEVFVNNVKFVEYQATDVRGIQENCIGVSKKVDGGIQESCIGGIQETLPNNISLKDKDNIVNNIDKIDKIDKSKIGILPSVEKEEKIIQTLVEPKPLTKQLLNCDYIEEDDLYIDEYNNAFDELLANYDLQLIRSALNYFTQRIKWNGCVDEEGKEISNKVAYFKTAIVSGIQRLLYENGLVDRTEGTTNIGYDWLRN